MWLDQGVVHLKYALFLYVKDFNRVVKNVICSGNFKCIFLLSLY